MKPRKSHVLILASQNDVETIAVYDHVNRAERDEVNLSLPLIALRCVVLEGRCMEGPWD
jgi:hypothetical protein